MDLEKKIDEIVDNITILLKHQLKEALIKTNRDKSKKPIKKFLEDTDSSSSSDSD